MSDKTGFLSDGKKRSHEHSLVMLTVPVLVLVPLAVSAWVAIAKGEPMHVDPTVPLYITAANGIILGYAAHGKYRETKMPAPAAAEAK